MRRFKATPQKKLVGMLILFVFLPLFLLWYVIFFLGNRPGPDTVAIISAVALLALYFYWKYKKQIGALAAATAPEEPESEPGKESPEGPESEAE